MRFLSVAVCFLALAVGCGLKFGAAQEVSLDHGRDLLKRGSYKDAIAVFTSLLEKEPGNTGARHGLLRGLIETGEYQPAEKKARGFLGSAPDDAGVRVALSEILFIGGKYAEANTEAVRAGEKATGAALPASMLWRARSLLAQGKEAEAGPLVQEFIHYYNSGLAKSAEELTLVARGLVLLEKVKEANELFIDAREVDPTYTDAYVGQGELLNQKYNYAEAASLFRDALKNNPNLPAAHVGLAYSKQQESNDEPLSEVTRALSVNPNYEEALVLRAWLELEADKTDSAMEVAQRALSINPNSIGGSGIKAAIHYLADRKNELEAETKRVMSINPHCGSFFDALAHFAVINRRYSDAVTFGKRAVEVSPRLWPARTQLGIQLLRVGQAAEARAELERAFASDPYNLWAKNSLDLMDSMKDFQDTVRGPFIVRASPDDSAVIGAYTTDLLDECHRRLSSKYHFTPKSPITVELFSNHEDFAVRSLGVPGLGALGVCFGQVIAMDSPKAREAGNFNWGDTLWHEFAHVITLQITDYRIPRWLSEGLSVYEERRALFPGWGDNWTLDKLKAFKEGRFVKLDDMEAAFTRPTRPDQVPLAYFQASMFCEYIEEKYGFDGILRILASYKEGLKTPEAFRKAFSTDIGSLDRAFNEYLKGKTAGYIEAVKNSDAMKASKEAVVAMCNGRPNDFFANLKLGTIYKTEGESEKAIAHFKQAIEAYPYYTGQGNPYAELAALYESKGLKQEAAAQLAALAKVDEDAHEALKRLAQLRIELGDKPGAIEALEAAFYIYPLDASLHQIAANAYLEQGAAPEAIREYQIVLALRPTDPAGAHYDLARAFSAGGKKADARRQVLRALEIAPGFEKAQELLLKLKGAAP